MSKVKLEKELARVRSQLSVLRQKEANLEQELKMAEDAEKQNILDKHHISVEKLMEMIKKSEAEERRILAMQREEKSEVKSNDEET